MNQHPKDFELDQDIVEFLEHYTIEYPSEQEISRTIEVLRAHVPRKRKPVVSYLSQLREMLTLTFNPAFILLSLVAYAAGMGIMVYGEKNPYLILLVLAPTPFLLGLFELIKGRERKMWELEQACKYSAQQLFLAKLTIVSFVSIGFNLLFSILIEASVENILFWKLTVSWVAPLCIVSSSSLYLSLKFRGWGPIALLPILWTGLSSAIPQMPNVMEWFESIPWVVYGVAIVSSLIFFGYQTQSVKRGIEIEANY
jgi:hypothetical protein